MFESLIQGKPENGDSFDPKESPMLQEFSFNVDVVFDDLTAIIPQYNNFVESRGNRVSEEMLECQQEALNTMRSIKNGERRPTTKEELIAELNDRERAERLSTPAKELVLGILER